MYTIYVYLLDTLADWELGYITSELHSGRFFKKNAPQITLKTVSHQKEAIKTMGGMTIVPDCLVKDIRINQTSILLLPGANTWNEPQHDAILDTAVKLLDANGLVCAICGATVALANRGLLNHHAHTSNGPGFLEMFAPAYKGQALYIDQPSVSADHIITAACTGALLWTKQILTYLNVFEADTLEYWYNYFSTGDSSQFYALMQSLPSAN